MNCDEQLYRDGEDYSSRDCDLKLGHPGDHEYLGQKFPRPVPAEPNEAVVALIERAAEKRGAWGLDEMQWPIVVEVTNVYIVAAPGATEDEALAYWADSGEYPSVENADAIDGGCEVRRVDYWQRGSLAGTAPFGPFIACPGCGGLSMNREWFHRPMRKCHGPIVWREFNSPSPRWRYSREHRQTPEYDASLQAVAA